MKNELTLGMKLKALRNSKKMTLQEVSEKSEVSIVELSQIENDKYKPRMVTIKKLSKAFDYDFEELYDYLY